MTISTTGLLATPAVATLTQLAVQLLAAGHLGAFGVARHDFFLKYQLTIS